MVFTSFLRGTPSLFVLTPHEGYLRLLWDKGGVNSSATFSPDGKMIAFASSVDGNTDIYSMPVEGNTPRRLTTARGIDTQPSWAPNGRQIAFTSTRSGSPQIYLMDADGSNVRRLTFDGGFHDEATWAHDGTRLACTTKVGNRFQIATIDTITGEQTVIPGPRQQRIALLLARRVHAGFRIGPHRLGADLHHRRRRRAAPADDRRARTIHRRGRRRRSRQVEDARSPQRISTLDFGCSILDTRSERLHRVGGRIEYLARSSHRVS